MLRTYQRITGSQTDYMDWRNLWEPLEIIFDGDREIEQYWNMFLRAYYLRADAPGAVSRRHFHNETGIPQSEIDWALWRDIMGY